MDPPTDTEVVAYQFYCPEDAWRAWADTVPRSVSLDDRLKELIHEDARATDRGGYDEMEERTARLLGTRIHHRARTARQALDEDDTTKAREELAEIANIAAMFDDQH